jgi:hypothetical protein
LLNDVFTTILGLVVGLLTGYYFEWRNSSATRAQNLELETKLRLLRESIYSVSARDDGAARSDGDPELSGQLLRWLREYQGPDGKMARTRVFERFSSLGFTGSEVMAALAKLDEQGHVDVGEEIQVR